MSSDDRGPATQLPPPSNPMAVARRLIADYTDVGQLTLRRWRGGWMTWQQAAWKETEDTVICTWLYRRLERAKYIDKTGKSPEVKPWEPNRHRVSDLADALIAITHLAEDVHPPAWLDGDEPAPAGEIVSAANGLLHVGTRKLYAHSPRYFGLTSVPFGYDPAAPTCTRSCFWSARPARARARPRACWALIGKGNVAGPTLASLGTNFGLSPLLGKPLAVISDARLGGPNTHQVVERLLSISGEDTLTVDRKYREPWTGKLPARLVILSNELPRFGDASGAISHRFVVLTMTRSLLHRENTQLTAELLTELPGILSWSLDGLDRLAKNGMLTEPASSGEAVAALQDLVSPVSAFVRDRCERTGEVTVADLFEAWQGWCADNGHKPGSAQTFGRDLRAVIPALRVVRPRDDGDRERRYRALSLTPDHNGPAHCQLGHARPSALLGLTGHPMSPQTGSPTTQPQVRTGVTIICVKHLRPSPARCPWPRSVKCAASRSTPANSSAASASAAPAIVHTAPGPPGDHHPAGHPAAARGECAARHHPRPRLRPLRPVSGTRIADLPDGHTAQ